MARWIGIGLVILLLTGAMTRKVSKYQHLKKLNWNATKVKKEKEK
jgi:type III secretory pathway component EscU